MPIEYNTDPNGQNLPTADGKGHEMLFELLDHSIHKKLPNTRSNRHDKQISRELQMLP
jgi:hypothetical protein